MSIKHYFSVYKNFLSTSCTASLNFRTSFILMILMDISSYITTFYAVSFMFNHIGNIGPWNKDQLLFFLSFMFAIDQLHMAQFSIGFWQFAEDIKSGAFDFTLLRPTNSIFNTFFRHFRPASFLNIFVVWPFLIYFGIKIHLNALDWILLPLLVLMGLTLMVLLEFIIITSIFWITEGIGINFIRLQLQNLARWPNFIYSYFTRKFFTIAIPLLLIGSAPVHFLYDYSHWPLLIAMIIAIVISWIILNFIWKIGLRNYNSASS